MEEEQTGNPREIPHELIAFAGQLGRDFGCRYLIYPGCGQTRQSTAQLHSMLEVLDLSLDDAIKSLPDESLKQSAILHPDFMGNPHDLVHLKQLMNTVPVCLIANPEGTQAPEPLEQWLKSEGLNVEFTGFTNQDMLTAVIGNSRWNKASGNPDFKVVALMCAYNEEDITEHSIRYLLNQGIYVYVMENWSLDSTWEMLHQFVDHPLFVGRERFPKEGPELTFNWLKILNRKRELSSTLEADWFIHYDMDEIRMSPWPQLNLKEAIRYVDQMGFNAIDHTVLEFMPVDNGYTGEVDFGTYFKHFDFGLRVDHFQQVKTWKNTGLPVALSMGGHDVSFEARKVCPYKFLMRHYPVRSQAHGERKVFVDRKPRWNPEERATHHHVHYDHIDTGYSFLRDPKDLKIFDPETFYVNFLAERLTGVSIKT